MRHGIFLSVLAISGLVSCFNSKNANENNGDKNALIRFKIDKPDFASLQPLRLSEYVDSIEYVQLETTTDCLLPPQGGKEMFHADNMLFLHWRDLVYAFDDATGKFLCRIGDEGPGPSEYVYIKGLCIDKDNDRIIIHDAGKESLMIFDYKGTHAGNISLSDTDSLFKNCYSTLSLVDVDRQNAVFIADFIPKEQACQPAELIVYDYRDKRVVQTLETRLGGKYTGLYTFTDVGMRLSTRYDGNFFYKAFYNDTMYMVNSGTIKPYAVIDLGSRKYPVEKIFLRIDQGERDYGKILLADAYINRDCILIYCKFLVAATQGTKFICRYDMKTGNVTYHKTYMVNDIDGGANIYNSGLYASSFSSGIAAVRPSVEVPEANKHLLLSSLEKSELKYPELKDKYEEMQKKRDWDDNPLLMILHWKQD
jgi:hypothetical protein